MDTVHLTSPQPDEALRLKGKVPKNFTLELVLVAGARGFEPRLTDPKTGVLPLDDAPTAPSCPKAHRAGCSVPNGSQTVKKKPTVFVHLSLSRNCAANLQTVSSFLVYFTVRMATRSFGMLFRALVG